MVEYLDKERGVGGIRRMQYSSFLYILYEGTTAVTTRPVVANYAPVGNSKVTRVEFRFEEGLLYEDVEPVVAELFGIS